MQFGNSATYYVTYNDNNCAAAALHVLNGTEISSLLFQLPSVFPVLSMNYLFTELISWSLSDLVFF